MSARKVNQAAIEIFILTSVLFVLLLTLVNIQNYSTPKKILGAETQIDPTQKLWSDFLSKNPNYVPGWVELGRMDKVREIDPNYEIVNRN
jgi:hypothetical protein